MKIEIDLYIDVSNADLHTFDIKLTRPTRTMKFDTTGRLF